MNVLVAPIEPRQDQSQYGPARHDVVIKGAVPGVGFEFGNVVAKPNHQETHKETGRGYPVEPFGHGSKIGLGVSRTHYLRRPLLVYAHVPVLCQFGAYSTRYRLFFLRHRAQRLGSRL